MDHDDYDDNDEYEEDDEQILDDSDGDEEDDDALLNHGVDNSAKEKSKEEQTDENEEELDVDEVHVEPEKKEKSFFVSGVTKIHFNEYSKILSKLATSLSEGSVVVPENYETLLNCECGNVITIAENWIKHRNKIPLPQDLYRTANGFIPEKLNISKLKTHDELCFKDLDAGEDFFDTCFRSNGYVVDYSKRK